MKLRVLGAVSAGLFSLGLVASANAALVSKLGNQVVYDTDRDITWMANVNLAASNTFGLSGINPDGKMNWSTSNGWIAAMNADGGTGYLGFNDWRLPTTLVPDVGCANLNGSPRSDSKGLDCTGSELGHIFYDELNATRNTSVLTTGDPTELAKFVNVPSSSVWSGTESDSKHAWIIDFNTGFQNLNLKGNRHFAWAVRSGDVSAVPVPAAAWLFGSGLLGMVGLARRKNPA